MSTRASAGKIRRLYGFIKAHRHECSVQAMCRLLDVTRSGYYAWLTEARQDGSAAESSRLVMLAVHNN